MAAEPAAPRIFVSYARSRARPTARSEDRKLKVWELEQEALLASLEGHGAGVTAVAVRADGRRAIPGSHDETLKVWDLERGVLLATLKGHGANVLAVAVTPDGRHAVSSSEDRTLRLWDLTTRREFAVFTGEARLSCCAITPDGRFVVAGDGAGQIHVLEILL